MFPIANLVWARCIAALLGIAVAVPAFAQSHPEKSSASKNSTDTTLTAELVKTGLFMIGGAGGNTLVRFSLNGLILVNGKLPGTYRALTSRTRRLIRMSDQPIRFLIVTDHQERHTGNNSQFLAAGIQVIAQDNVKPTLASLGSAAGSTAGAAPGLPTITFDRNYTLRLGGIEAEVMHFGNARTNGDSVVYFPNLKVVAVGDLFSPDAPEPDYSNGGSLVNWGAVLAQVLKLDFDVVVPSTGPLVSRADLEAFKTKIDTLVSRAVALVKDGVPQDEIMVQLKTDDLGWRYAFTGEQLDRFYADVSRAK